MDELGSECTILAAKTAKTLAQVGGSTHKSITFSFDRCYGAKITTADIYNEIPYSLVQVRYVEQTMVSVCRVLLILVVIRLFISCTTITK